MIYKTGHALLVNPLHQIVSPVVPKNACSWQRSYMYGHKVEGEFGFKEPDMYTGEEEPFFLPVESFKRTIEYRKPKVDMSDYLTYSCIVFIRDPFKKFLSGVCEWIIRAVDWDELGFQGDYILRNGLQKFNKRDPKLFENFCEVTKWYIDDMFSKDHFSKDEHTELQTNTISNIREVYPNSIWMEVNANLVKNVKHWANANHKNIPGLCHPESDSFLNNNADIPFKIFAKGYLDGLLTDTIKKEQVLTYLAPDINLYNEVKSLCYRGGEQ